MSDNVPSWAKANILNADFQMYSKKKKKKKKKDLRGADQ